MKNFLNRVNPMNEICFITDVRCDENIYHVTYADGESLEFPVTDEITKLLESRLEKQVMKGQKKLASLECFQKDYFPILATSVLLQEVTSAFLVYHIFNSNENQATLYSMTSCSYAFINTWLLLYKSKLDNKINALSSDIEPLLNKMGYKEKMTDFIHSPDAKTFLDEDMYHRLLSATEEGKNPFSLIKFDDFTDCDISNFMSVLAEVNPSDSLDKGFQKKK